ncbi:uncharacterized protein LOC115630755 [Scaptodrosophila lebanonensis]|uniref:Uncharacterized protein LOC115630755 n=1 Tax=Drosophila lebanonensis TaxID=7225 RepID=A0A6J2U4I0_DROLE|nr:uncharacterized protein LOC115630755 [Scaptodrosophila lebanonensis]
MSAHKEAAKQRKRKSLKMALEKCMQRRDAEAAAAVAGSTSSTGSEVGGIAGSGSVIASTTLALRQQATFEDQQQKLHQEVALQIKAAMAAEQEQLQSHEGKSAGDGDTSINVAESSAMDITGSDVEVNEVSSLVEPQTTRQHDPHAVELPTTSVKSEDVDLCESKPAKMRKIEVDEPRPIPASPVPASATESATNQTNVESDVEPELVVVEPKIEPLSDSEDNSEEIPRTPTPPATPTMPANESPTLTSTPKAIVD